MCVIVIGGGITGLVAARALRTRGVAVTLVDRTFPFGGRLRPERIDIPGYGRAVFDPRPVFLGPRKYGPNHPDAPLGFPPLGLRSDEFSPEALHTLRQIPIVHVSSGSEPLPRPPAAGVTVEGGAKGLIDLLLPLGCDDHFERLSDTEVIALEPEGMGWRVRVRECGATDSDDRASRTVHADAVLLTQPVPETLALFEASNVTLPDTLGNELRAVRYQRAMTLYAAFRGPSALPAGMLSFSDSPLALMFDNPLTGASRSGPAVTAVVNPDWATEHWGESDEEIARRLLPLVASWAGGELVWHRVQRREHDRPTHRVRMPFAEASDLPPLVIAGDGFSDYVSNALDAAYTSATHAVSHLCRALGRVVRIVGRRTPRTPSRTVVEVAVSSAEEASFAIENGADRLLLLAAPEVGGLTPSLDTFLTVRTVAVEAAGRGRRIPITVLLRPRLGDCIYDAGEVSQLLRDARRFLLVGADGIAFGALALRRAETRVDADACRALVELAHAHAKEAVFHRAFDALRDRRTGLQDLIALSFDRVLTAGRWKLACDCVSDLAADVAYAGWDIDVVAAGGIGPEMAGYVVAETGCPGVLLGLRRTSRSRSANSRRSFESHRHTPPDGERVAATVDALRRAEQADEPADPFGDEPAFGQVRGAKEDQRVLGVP
jgi:copper homeostasis protein